MEQMKLKIQGMTCQHCVHAVSSRLSKLPGVQVEDVQIGSATIRRDPGVATMAAIQSAIADEGYAVVS